MRGLLLVVFTHALCPATTSTVLASSSEQRDRLVLCNYAWESADFLSHALAETLTASHPHLFPQSATGERSVVLSAEEMSKSDMQFDFIREGKCDVGLECWSAGGRSCEAEATAHGLAFRKHEHFVGDEGIYVPQWLTDAEPRLGQWPEGYQVVGSSVPLHVPSNLKVLGVPAAYRTTKRLWCFTQAWQQQILSELSAEEVSGEGTTVEATNNATALPSSDEDAMTPPAMLAFCRALGVPDYFYERMVFTDTNNFSGYVLAALRNREPLLFYHWTGYLTATTGASMLMDPMDPAPIYIIWRDVDVVGRVGEVAAGGPSNNTLSSSTPLVPQPLPPSPLLTHAARFLSQPSFFNITIADVITLTKLFSKRASITLPDGDVKRDFALKTAASEFVCDKYGLQHACSDSLDHFPRKKHSSLPDKIIVWTKFFPAFVDRRSAPGSMQGYPTCNASDAVNFAPPSGVASDLTGYTIDHVYEVLQILGYLREDVTWRCALTTSELIDLAGREMGHMSVAAITITQARMSVVDFSSPYYTTGYRVLVKSEKARPKMDGLFFATPFSWDVWQAIVVFTVCAGLMLALMEAVAGSRRDEQLQRILDEEGVIESAGAEGVVQGGEGVVLQRDVVESGGSADSARWNSVQRALRSFDSESLDLLLESELVASTEEKRLFLNALHRSHEKLPVGPAKEIAGRTLRTSTTCGIGSPNPKAARSGSSALLLDTSSVCASQASPPSIGIGGEKISSGGVAADTTCSVDSIHLDNGMLDVGGPARPPPEQENLIPDDVSTASQNHHLSHILRRINRLKLAKQLAKSQYDVSTFLLCGRSDNLTSIRSTPGQILANLTLVFGTLLLSVYIASLAAQLSTRPRVSKITSIDDVLNLPNGRIAVHSPRPDTVNYVIRYVQQNLAQLQMVRVNGYLEMTKAVLEGRADAAVYDETALRWLAQQSSCGAQLDVVGEIFGPQEYGYAFPKDSSLREPVSEAITYLRTTKHPSISEVLEAKHFGGGSRGTCALSVSTAVDDGQLSYEEFEFLFLALGGSVLFVFGVWLLSGCAFWGVGVLLRRLRGEPVVSSLYSGAAPAWRPPKKMSVGVELRDEEVV